MTRSKYMQELLSSTYPHVAIEAISGGFDGAWERLIASRLRKDYSENHSESVEIVNSLYAGDDFTLREAFRKAAYLITSSKIEGHEKTI
jgi:hypothetical protein